MENTVFDESKYLQLINNGKANLTLNNIGGNLADIDNFKNDLPSKIQDRILNKFNKHMTLTYNHIY